ncbi:unnamed protein product [Acanthosepion pharaonis]|uniref:Uncharacterized protein n=1 Tax=Acanthosepion pharaonis TaxID=158019 RepID=A0A812CX12_ACAPH|nr:unnamed protein product [Sepia pharaonis]
MHTSNRAQSRDDVISRLNERQESQKAQHDRNARDLPPLYKGQKIFIQDQSTNRWKPAQVQNVCEEPRSYMVKQDEGGVVRRNRHQLLSPSPSPQRRPLPPHPPTHHFLPIPQPLFVERSPHLPLLPPFSQSSIPLSRDPSPFRQTYTPHHTPSPSPIKSSEMPPPLNKRHRSPT